ncbi:unnamed protein product [Cylindrotheca closterium]|uniref:Uncharacterized protein n=1 Tax=Cylindrotheca closterium TaxID=2856 RepID=A0AAD2GEH4_9STRA|nr:unnamed protein product [Cylindrotheca closterium]
MTESACEDDSYVEPPLSQLEIPYKMNFSASEDEKKEQKKCKRKRKARQREMHKSSARKKEFDSSSSSDSDASSSSSSSCGSFDSHPDRKVKNREPLRVNDIISYTPPVFTIGTNVKQAVVLGISPSERSFPLILDNADMLPWDTYIQRIGEYYGGQIYKHAGRIKPLTSFRLQQGGTKDVTIGLKQKASNFKQMLNDMQQRAMATLRGEMEAPSKSQSPDLSSKKAKAKAKRPAVSSIQKKGSNHLSNANTARKEGEDVASTSSDSSMGLPVLRKGRGKDSKQTTTISARKPTATKTSKQTPQLVRGMNKSTESSSEDDASSSSNDDSVPLEKLAVKMPRGYARSKKLSLTKTNSVTSPTPRLGTGRSKPKPNTTKKKTRPKTNQAPSKQEVNKNAYKTSPRSTKDYPITVDSSADDSVLKGKGPNKVKAPKRNRSKAFPPTTFTTLNDDTDSDSEDGPSPKGLVPKHIQGVLQNHRKARTSLARRETVLWSGSDSESDELTAGIEKTLEQQRKRRKVLEGQDTLAILSKSASKPNGKSRSTRLPSKSKKKMPQAKAESNKGLEIGSSSSDESIVEGCKTSQKKELPKRAPPQGQFTNAMLGLGSEDSSSDDDEDLLLATLAFATQNAKKQSPKKKKKVLSNRTNQKKKRTVPCYDADEDSENDEALLAKPVWFHNHSSERKVKSPSPSKVQTKFQQTPSSDRKAFPKSPSNASRSRLVQDIRREKMLFSSPSPTPRKASKPPQQYELSPSSSDTDSDTSILKSGRREKKEKRNDWSSDCSVDSPPEQCIASPSPKTRKKTEEVSNGNKKRRLGKELDFSPNDGLPNKSRSKKGRKILSPFSRRKQESSSTKRPKTAIGKRS